MATGLTASQADRDAEAVAPSVSVGSLVLSGQAGPWRSVWHSGGIQALVTYPAWGLRSDVGVKLRARRPQNVSDRRRQVAILVLTATATGGRVELRSATGLSDERNATSHTGGRRCGVFFGEPYGRTYSRSRRAGEAVASPHPTTRCGAYRSR